MDSKERDRQLKECYKRINDSFERSRKRWESLQRHLDDISKKLDARLNIMKNGYVGKFKEFHKLSKP